jgi:hypothetical protein
MPQFDALSVYIVDPRTKSPFEEYKITKKDKKTQCYIESKVGQRFKIVINLPDGNEVVKDTYLTAIDIEGEDIDLEDSLGGEAGPVYATDEYEGNQVESSKLEPLSLEEPRFTGWIPFFSLLTLC